LEGIIDLSETAEFQGASQLAIEHVAPEEDEQLEITDGQSEIDQLDKNLLTLSIVPQSRWQTLLNLDSIRQRNKPIQPPEKPKAAPFFLGSTLTNGEKSDNNSLLPNGDPKTMVDDTERSRISRLASLSQVTSQSHMSTLLQTYNTTTTTTTTKPDPTPISEHLASLPPSAADLEIRSLTLDEMPIFVRALTSQVGRRKFFELVNTWMSVFLKLHGDFVGEVEELRGAVLEWRAAMEGEERRLAGLVGYTRGVVDFLRSVR
jgi:U3 small nucleolar RNA-associated protein 21